MSETNATNAAAKPEITAAQMRKKLAKMRREMTWELGKVTSVESRLVAHIDECIKLEERLGEQDKIEGRQQPKEDSVKATVDLSAFQ